MASTAWISCYEIYVRNFGGFVIRSKPEIFSNMNKQTIKKTIIIKAPGNQVWNVLTDDDLTRRWYAAFSEGTHAETDWKEGSKVLFTDNTNNGLIGTIAGSKPGELLSIAFTGVVVKGKEDYESELAKSVRGGKETYRLIQENGHTNLYIECDTSED